VDAIEAILGRRSTRRWRDGDVSASALATILECGAAAPSSKDARPWRLHPVSDPALLAAIADAMLADERAARYVPVDPSTGLPRADYESSVGESAEVIRRAACGIFVENESPFPGGRGRLVEAAGESLAEALVGYSFEMIGIGAAIENMWLAAHALGLGAVFIGDVLIAEQYVTNALEMNGDLVGLIAIGRV
jgi:nitroreductase